MCCCAPETTEDNRWPDLECFKCSVHGVGFISTYEDLCVRHKSMKNHPSNKGQ